LQPGLIVIHTYFSKTQNIDRCWNIWKYLQHLNVVLLQLQNV